MKLEQHNDSMSVHENRTLQNFIMGKVALITDDNSDIVKQKRKLDAVAICTEKRRKLFIKDFMCEKELNWEQVRGGHRSISEPLKADIKDEDLSNLLDMYNRFKTDDDLKESADMLIVIVPGPPANTPDHKSSAQVCKFMKNPIACDPRAGAGSTCARVIS